MGKTLEEKLAGLSMERRARITAQTAALIAEEKSLSELRRARSHPKKASPKTLTSDRRVFPSLKAAPNLMLSTLQHHVAAMGGRLDLMSLVGLNVETSARLTPSRSRRKKDAGHR